jgi:hypothetical protein
MFINSEDFLEIKVYYRRIKNSVYIAKNEKDYNDLSDEDKTKYKCLVVKTKQLTWGMYNEINEESVIKDISSGSRVWNSKLYKENKLKKILASWDAMKEEKGKVVPVPITPETIKSLAKEIAETILVEYDSLTEMSDEEEGN